MTPALGSARLTQPNGNLRGQFGTWTPLRYDPNVPLQARQEMDLRCFRGARSVFICQNGPPSDVAHVLRELPNTTLTLSVSDTVPSVQGSVGRPHQAMSNRFLLCIRVGLTF